MPKKPPYSLAMIPARMGSQRLKHKNLQELAGMSLIVRAIRKCREAEVFDEIWVNSEHCSFKDIAHSEGVKFHPRPEELASDSATSEDFVYEFLKCHPCEILFQVHSIAPLLTAQQVAEFVKAMKEDNCDVQLSYVNEQIECALKGKPINFTFDKKTNSQELLPIQRITWSITGWRADSFISAYEAGGCATYAGKTKMYPIDRLAGHMIKTKEDLEVAEALFQIFRK